jgi:hypothetical protein
MSRPRRSLRWMMILQLFIKKGGFKMTREEMFNEVIYKFGFESPYTIIFAKYLENQDEKLKKTFDYLMKKSIEEE